MSRETWAAVDAALEQWLLSPDAALQAALDSTTAAGMPPINVTALQGKMLRLLARSIAAERILEIGTLGGYSTIWLAGGLGPSGRLTSLEVDAKHAEVARNNIARAGFADRVDVIVGPALETLATLDGQAFDLTFIDADKVSTPAYFDWAVAHTRPRGLVVVDNVVREGGVIDPQGDANVQGMRAFLEAAGRDRRVDVTALQTVGGKNYDGFAIALVK